MKLETLIREGDLADQSSTLTMLEETAAGLWLIDPAGITTWVNQAASELVGSRGDDLLGLRAPDFIFGNAAAPLGFLHGERRWDHKLTRSDRSTIWISITAKPLFDAGGRPGGTLLTLFEISERKEREVELRMRLEAQEALVELAELSIEAPSHRAILARSVALVAEQLDATLASVSTVDLQQHEVNVVAAAGREDGSWAKELEKRGPMRVSDQSLVRAAIEQAEPVVVEDFDRDPIFEPGPQLAAHGIRSATCVPLSDGESVLAALGDQPEAAGRSALPLIESVARMITGYRIQEREMSRTACPRPARNGATSPPGFNLSAPRRSRRRP